MNDHGVTLREYSDDIMEAAWRESNAYLAELSAPYDTEIEVVDGVGRISR